MDDKVKWVKKSKNARLFPIGVESLPGHPDTIRSLIKHLYGRPGELPAQVS